MGDIPDSVIAALRGQYMLGLFLRVGTTPALHLSFGINDVPIQLPDHDAPGTVYKGAGILLDIPTFEALINGLADKVTFTMSGLDPQAVALMLDAAPEVLGARVTIGIAPMDERHQPKTQIIGLWTGTADFVSEEGKIERDPTKNRTQTLMLTTSTGDTSRAFPNLLTYTDAVQRAPYPTDGFYRRVSRYVSTYLVR